MSKLKARKIAPRGGGLIEAVYDWRVGNKSGRSNFTHPCQQIDMFLASALG
jgi:hypothetical protein